MGNDTRERFAGPAWETLEAWLREQARDMIQQAPGRRSRNFWAG